MPAPAAEGATSTGLTPATGAPSVPPTRTIGADAPGLHDADPATNLLLAFSLSRAQTQP